MIKKVIIEFDVELLNYKEEDAFRDALSVEVDSMLYEFGMSKTKYEIRIEIKK